MALETAVTINQLDPANPAGPDRVANGDDHIRLIKAALKATFPSITGPVTLTQAFLNSLASLVVPFGVINMWYGLAANIPAGYALCDGATVAKSDGSGTVPTPDMRGRVVVGASVAHLTGTTFGQDVRAVTSELGGSHTHTGNTASGGAHTHSLSIDGTALTIAQMPAHTHTQPSNGGSGAGSTFQSTGGLGGSLVTGSEGGGATHTHTGSAASGGAHTHTMALDAAAAHAHTVNVDVTQASIALHYIMKI